MSRVTAEAALGALSSGVLLQGLSGALVLCNAAAERLLGRSFAQLASEAAPFSAVAEDGAALAPAEHPAMVALRTGAPVQGTVLGVQRHDGALLWLRVHASLLRDARGAVTGVLSTLEDVSDYKRLTEVIDAGLDGYWARDLSQKTIILSPQIAELFGFPAVETVGPVDAVLERIHPDDLPGQRAVFTGLLPGPDDEFALDLRVLHRDGTWHWVCSRGKVVERDTQGRPLRLVGSITTLHARKVAELAAREQERALRELVAHSPAAVVICRGGVVELINAAALELWGAAAAAQLLGTPVLELFHPDARPALAERMNRALGGAPMRSADHQITTLEGQVRTVESTGVRFVDERGPALQVVLRDVTDERRATLELAASEARFRRLAERSPAGVFEADLSGRLRYFNRAVAELVGTFTPGLWFDFVHPEDREQVRRDWQQLGAGSLTSEYRLLAPRGHELLVRADVTAVTDLSGRVTGLTGVVVDLSERTAKLEQFAVNARLTALGTFVGGVAHEINNPLAAVVAAQAFVLEELGRGPGGLDPRELGEALRDAQEGTDRITRIVKDLERFGRSDQRRQKVNLDELVREVIAWLPAFMTEGAAIAIEGSAPEVLASPSQLAQVLVNLTSNAAQSLVPGRPGHIVVRLGTGAPGMASLEVTDDGAGITAEVMRRIFDPFFTTREVRQGMGLGLPVVRAIVTANGGTITAASTPGEGSTFRVELPVFTPEPPRGFASGGGTR